MVKITLKSGEVFGIEGYHLPKTEYPIKWGTKNAFPKEKGKNFAEVQAGYTKGFPGPGEYPVGYKWGCASSNAYKTKKNTFLDQIARIEKEKPSPAEFKINYNLVDKRP